jgi:hypothetical protein
MRSLLLLLALAIPASAQFTACFNFRATSAYVTDPTCARDSGANTGYVLASDAYPTTRTVNGQSFTFGWVADVSADLYALDEDVTNPQLAGINYVTNGTGVRTFRVTLPSAGMTIRVRIAGGGAIYGGYTIDITALDNTTTLFSVSASTSSGSFVDANNTVRTSAADWLANNAAQTVTMVSATLNIRLNATISPISTVQIEQVSTAKPKRKVIQ